MLKNLLIQFWLGFIGLIVTLALGLWMIQVKAQGEFIRSVLQSILTLLVMLFLLILYRMYGGLTPEPPEPEQKAAT